MSIFGKNKKANDKLYNCNCVKKIANTCSNFQQLTYYAKIKLVEVSQLHFDRDFKNVFQQENDKVTEIANDIIYRKCVITNYEYLQ